MQKTLSELPEEKKVGFRLWFRDFLWLRSADNFDVLQSAVTDLLDHVGAKLKVSSFSVQRVLGLIESVAKDVRRAIGRVLAKKAAFLSLLSTDLYIYSSDVAGCLKRGLGGFYHCRRVARDSAH